jgi:hypothetical protein
MAGMAAGPVDPRRREPAVAGWRGTAEAGATGRMIAASTLVDRSPQGPMRVLIVEAHGVFSGRRVNTAPSGRVRPVPAAGNVRVGGDDETRYSGHGAEPRPGRPSEGRRFSTDSASPRFPRLHQPVGAGRSAVLWRVERPVGRPTHVPQRPGRSDVRCCGIPTVSRPTPGARQECEVRGVRAYGVDLS